MFDSLFSCSRFSSLDCLDAKHVCDGSFCRSSSKKCLLTVARKRDLVAAAPVGTAARAELVNTVTLVEKPTVSTASRSQATKLTVLVDRLTDPVRTRITTDGRMRRVNKDNLIKLESGILGNPVRVQHTKIAQMAASTLLSNSTKAAGILGANEILQKERPKTRVLCEHDSQTWFFGLRQTRWA